MPPGVRLVLRTGALADELAALAEEGVQSLLLEGGATLAESFLREDLVDKVMLFVAPTIGRNGPAFAPELLALVQLRRFRAERVGDDLLLGGYVHEP
jgi:diaminohydroxyphosphoribosylaminopyrimidine deaminase/5-amino-6-(5-phosphoribosylamino)uracil reductase